MASKELQLLPQQAIEHLRTGVSLPNAAISAAPNSLLPFCLVEVVSNSLDAGAGAISCRLLGALEKGFVVEDDGPGIPAAQLSLIGTRYASSKHAGGASLGYRGEALASIAAISRLRIITRAAGSFETHERLISQGKLLRQGPVYSSATAGGGQGSSSSGAGGLQGRGTLVEVRQLTTLQQAASHGPNRAVNLGAQATMEKEAARHALLCVALPFAHVDVKMLDDRGALLMHLPKGRNLLAWVPRALGLEGLPPDFLAGPQGEGLRWMEEVEDATAATLSAACGIPPAGPAMASSGGSHVLLVGRYRLQGVVLGLAASRLGPDAQLAYVNGRKVALPEPLQALVVGWHRAALLRMTRDYGADQEEEKENRQQHQGHQQQRWGGSRDPSRDFTRGFGGATASAGTWWGSDSNSALKSSHPAYLLMLEVTPGDVMVDGEADKGKVTLRRCDTAAMLLSRMLQRAWGRGPPAKGNNSQGGVGGGVAAGTAGGQGGAPYPLKVLSSSSSSTNQLQLQQQQPQQQQQQQGLLLQHQRHSAPSLVQQLAPPGAQGGRAGVSLRTQLLDLMHLDGEGRGGEDALLGMGGGDTHSGRSSAPATAATVLKSMSASLLQPSSRSRSLGSVAAVAGPCKQLGVNNGERARAPAQQPAYHTQPAAHHQGNAFDMHRGGHVQHVSKHQLVHHSLYNPVGTQHQQQVWQPPAGSFQPSITGHGAQGICAGAQNRSAQQHQHEQLHVYDAKAQMLGRSERCAHTASYQEQQQQQSYRDHGARQHSDTDRSLQQLAAQTQAHSQFGLQPGLQMRSASQPGSHFTRDDMHVDDSDDMEVEAAMDMTSIFHLTRPQQAHSTQPAQQSSVVNPRAAHTSMQPGNKFAQGDWGGVDDQSAWVAAPSTAVYEDTDMYTRASGSYAAQQTHGTALHVRSCTQQPYGPTVPECRIVDLKHRETGNSAGGDEQDQGIEVDPSLWQAPALPPARQWDPAAVSMSAAPRGSPYTSPVALPAGPVAQHYAQDGGSSPGIMELCDTSPEVSQGGQWAGPPARHVPTPRTRLFGVVQEMAELEEGDNTVDWHLQEETIPQHLNSLHHHPFDAATIHSRDALTSHRLQYHQQRSGLDEHLSPPISPTLPLPAVSQRRSSLGATLHGLSHMGIQGMMINTSHDDLSPLVAATTHRGGAGLGTSTPPTPTPLPSPCIRQPLITDEFQTQRHRQTQGHHLLHDVSTRLDSSSPHHNTFGTSPDGPWQSMPPQPAFLGEVGPASPPHLGRMEQAAPLSPPPQFDLGEEEEDCDPVLPGLQYHHAIQGMDQAHTGTRGPSTANRVPLFSRRSMDSGAVTVGKSRQPLHTTHVSAGIDSDTDLDVSLGLDHDPDPGLLQPMQAAGQQCRPAGTNRGHHRFDSKGIWQQSCPRFHRGGSPSLGGTAGAAARQSRLVPLNQPMDDDSLQGGQPGDGCNTRLGSNCKSTGAVKTADSGRLPGPPASAAHQHPQQQAAHRAAAIAVTASLAASDFSLAEGLKLIRAQAAQGCLGRRLLQGTQSHTGRGRDAHRHAGKHPLRALSAPPRLQGATTAAAAAAVVNSTAGAAASVSLTHSAATPAASSRSGESSPGQQRMPSKSAGAVGADDDDTGVHGSRTGRFPESWVSSMSAMRRAASSIKRSDRAAEPGLPLHQGDHPSLPAGAPQRHSGEPVPAAAADATVGQSQLNGAAMAAAALPTASLPGATDVPAGAGRQPGPAEQPATAEDDQVSPVPMNAGSPAPLSPPAALSPPAPPLSQQASERCAADRAAAGLSTTPAAEVQKVLPAEDVRVLPAQADMPGGVSASAVAPVGSLVPQTDAETVAEMESNGAVQAVLRLPTSVGQVPEQNISMGLRPPGSGKRPWQADADFPASREDMPSTKRQLSHSQPCQGAPGGDSAFTSPQMLMPAPPAARQLPVQQVPAAGPEAHSHQSPASSSTPQAHMGQSLAVHAPVTCATFPSEAPAPSVGMGSAHAAAGSSAPQSSMLTDGMPAQAPALPLSLVAQVAATWENPALVQRRQVMALAFPATSEGGAPPNASGATGWPGLLDGTGGRAAVLALEHLPSIKMLCNPAMQQGAGAGATAGGTKPSANDLPAPSAASAGERESGLRNAAGAPSAPNSAGDHAPAAASATRTGQAGSIAPSVPAGTAGAGSVEAARGAPHTSARHPTAGQSVSAAAPAGGVTVGGSTTLSLQDLEGCRILGQVDNKFLVACTTPPEGVSARDPSWQPTVFIVDQHAAHERVRLEHLTSQLLNTLYPRRVSGPSGRTAALNTLYPGISAGRAAALDAHTAAHSAYSTESNATTLSDNSMLGARRGNGCSNRDPPALATHRLQPPYPPVPMSSKEVIAWEAHKDLVIAWGWELSQALNNPSHTNDATSSDRLVQQVPVDHSEGNAAADGMQDDGAQNQSSAGHSSSKQGTMLEPPGVSGAGCWVLTSVPLVYGVPLGAGDLCTYLQQLAGTRVGQALQGGASGPSGLAAPSTTAAAGRETHLTTAAAGRETHLTTAIAGREAACTTAAAAAHNTATASNDGYRGTALVVPRRESGTGSAVLQRVPLPRMGSLPPGVLRVLRSRACRTAIMFGDELEPGEMAGLVRALSRTAQWGECAHGRPTCAPLVHLPTLSAQLDLRDKSLSMMAREGVSYSAISTGHTTGLSMMAMGNTSASINHSTAPGSEHHQSRGVHPMQCNRLADVMPGALPGRVVAKQPVSVAGLRRALERHPYITGQVRE